MLIRFFHKTNIANTSVFPIGPVSLKFRETSCLGANQNSGFAAREAI